MVGYSFLDDSFIRNPMPVYPGANQPCRLLTPLPTLDCRFWGGWACTRACGAYFILAPSDFAAMRMGMSVSASFQRGKKASDWARALSVSPARAKARALLGL